MATPLSWAEADLTVTGVGRTENLEVNLLGAGYGVVNLLGDGAGYGVVNLLGGGEGYGVVNMGTGLVTVTLRWSKMFLKIELLVLVIKTS